MWERERERERDLGVGGYREKLIKLEEKGEIFRIKFKRLPWLDELVVWRGSLSFKSIFILDYWWGIENPQIVKFRVICILWMKLWNDVNY